MNLVIFSVSCGKINKSIIYDDNDNQVINNTIRSRKLSRESWNEAVLLHHILVYIIISWLYNHRAALLFWSPSFLSSRTFVLVLSIIYSLFTYTHIYIRNTTLFIFYSLFLFFGVEDFIGMFINKFTNPFTMTDREWNALLLLNCIWQANNRQEVISNSDINHGIHTSLYGHEIL